ncbi:MAG TPA: D-alanyl-D-alanine carboxypeptidase family protein [bacterium]|nr:D-alanyl-D-alanine carboxypeptidase family protein [bacterium]
MNFASFPLLLSVMFSSVGLTSQAQKIDQSLVQSVVSPSNFAIASEEIGLPEIKIPPRVREGASKAVANAQNYILVDPDSGTIFAKSNHRDRVPIASTTKIMTAALVMENYKLSDVVTVSSAAANQIGADAHLQTGEKITVHNLLKALLVKSANGAAYALAEHMNTLPCHPREGGDPCDSNVTGVTKFVSKMNEKAKELGMNDTDYHDPAGLDVTGYSSAFDLAIITKYAMQNETVRQIVKTKEASITDVSGNIWHKLENSNRLVREWDYPGAIGVKTGFMPEAGHCLVGAATRDGHTLIAVVLKTFADTPSASAEEARRLLDWGFANVAWGN